MQWKRLGIGFGVLCLAGLIAAVGLARIADSPSGADETPAVNIVPTPEMVARGKYLAHAADCAACHTAPGGKPFAGGLAMALPFGKIYTSNITPDPDVGIGSWSDADFIAAMYRGISRDGRHLFPAMPYINYTKMPVDDVLAIKAFLLSQDPVPVRPSANSLSFPFNQTWGLAYWNLLFNTKRRFEPDPAVSTEVNRGAYLAEGPGHCGGCHTPRNLLFAEKSGDVFAGAVVENQRAYNITSDPNWGIGGWSIESLVAYMRTGHAQGHGVAAGSMGLVVQESLSHLSDQDLHAIAVYLKQTSPRKGDVAVPQNVDSAAPISTDESDGQHIYAGACAGCHGVGEGAPLPLTGFRSVNDAQGFNAISAILKGINVKTPTGDIHMPAFARSYSDAEIAAVTRYVAETFGSTKSDVGPNDVKEARGE